MTALLRVTGRVAVVPLDNVSTDVIIPTRHAVQPDRAAMAGFAFEALRNDPGFAFNRPDLIGAPILLAGANFACGSSREPAVWALAALGVRVVIARSFGDIFAQNAARNFLLAVTVADDVWNALATTAADVTVDVDARTIAWEGGTCGFDMPERRRHMLMNGLDEIEATMTMIDTIAAFQARDAVQRPWVHDRPLPVLDAARLADPGDGR